MEGVEITAKVCWFYQTGYCKYGSECKRYHEHETCKERKCNQNQCRKRHPQECKYFRNNNYCKFGVDCSFSHSETFKKDEFEIVIEEVKNLKVEVDNLKRTFQILLAKKPEAELLMKEIKSLKDDIEIIQIDNFKISEKIIQVEEEFTDSEEDLEEVIEAEHKCEKCNFMCVGDVTMKKHLNTKHGSLQKDNAEHDSKEEVNKESLDADLEDFFQIEVVDGETLYVCNICNEGVDNENMIKIHMHENHEEFENHIQDSDKHADAENIEEKTDEEESFDDYDYYEGFDEDGNKIIDHVCWS